MKYMTVQNRLPYPCVELCTAYREDLKSLRGTVKQETDIIYKSLHGNYISTDLLTDTAYQPIWFCYQLIGLVSANSFIISADWTCSYQMIGLVSANILIMAAGWTRIR